MLALIQQERVRDASKKKNVVLIEPAAGNVDQALQKAVLTRYAEKHNLGVDLIVGDRTPQAGAPGNIKHRDLINDVRSGGVGRLIVLSDVRHAVPDELLDQCRASGVQVDFVDIQQESGLAQTS